MSIMAGLLKAIFGTKSDKDRKEVQPYVDKILAIYPKIDSLSNDELRARSAALRAAVALYVKPEEDEIIKLKLSMESPDMEIDKKEA
ncbi:MAG: hypothetical protein J6R62_02210, partial [Rikenellaceae bacterium]|nr:hypothetical protein [Rikenellaceae bacterium]